MNPIIKRIHERFKRIEEELKMIHEELLEYEKSLEKKDTKQPVIKRVPKLPIIPKIIPPYIPLRYPPKQSKDLKSKGEIK